MRARRGQRAVLPDAVAAMILTCKMNTSHTKEHAGNPPVRPARILQLFLAAAALLLAPSCLAWHFSGVVWYDLKSNGVEDPGEKGVSGVTVLVRNCTNNTLVVTATTASDGSFSFTDASVPLSADYRVGFTNLPPG